MRGGLLVQTVLFSFASLLAVVFAVIHTAEGEPVIDTLLVEALALMSLAFGQIVYQLGKRRGGRVGARWITGVVGLPIMTLIVWLLTLLSGYDHTARLIAGAVLVIATVIASPGVVIENHRGRLGQPGAKPER